MKQITSLINPDIKLVHQLHIKKGRQEQQRFIAEGLRTCSTLVESSVHLARLYVTEETHEKALEIFSKDKITVVSPIVMKKISLATTPSEFLGVFTIPKQPTFKQLGPGLVLAQISDPGNAGTLIRTAAAMSIKTIILIESVDPWNPKVVQATAGSIGFVNIFSWTWEELLANKGSLTLNALVVEGGKPLDEVDPKNALLVIGSEAHGLPHDWLEDCKEKITISMPGNVESLNAAVAGSIALYEVFGKSCKI